MATNGIILSRADLNALNGYLRRGLPRRGVDSNGQPASPDKQQVEEFSYILQRDRNPVEYAMPCESDDAQAYLDSAAHLLTAGELATAQSAVDSIGPLLEADYGTDADPPPTVVPWD
jgi:hypothetical protein